MKKCGTIEQIISLLVFLILLFIFREQLIQLMEAVTD